MPCGVMPLVGICAFEPEHAIPVFKNFVEKCGDAVPNNLTCFLGVLYNKDHQKEILVVMVNQS